MAYDVGVRLGVDGEKAFRDSINAINANIKAMGSELRAVTAQFAKNAESEAALAAKNEVLAKSITATKEKIGVLEKQLSSQAEKLQLLGNALDEVIEKHGADSKEALNAQNAYNLQAKAVAKLQDQLNGAKADLANMENALEDNERAMDQFGKETEEAGEAMDDAGEKAVSFGDILKANIVSDLIVDGLRKLTDGLKDFARFALDSGMNFEAQMSRVQAISGATGDEAALLAEKAKEMGETTVFSATESAEALEYMAMAGWKTNDMLDGLEGIMHLAAASGEELSTTSDIVTDALTAFGLTAEDSTHFADVLAAASTNANTNVAMMGETFKYVAPVAGSLGYSVEDSAVAIGLMANSGIKATQAGTALRSLLTRMSKPTKEAQAAMDALGLSLQNGDGSMKSFMEIMDEMRAGFGNLMISQEEFDEAFNALNASFEAGEITQENYEATLERLISRAYGAEGAERARYAAMLAGQEAMSGMLAIVSASDEDYLKLKDAIYGADGAAEEMASTMTDNLSGSLTLMQSAAEGVGISLYEKVKEPLREVVDDITNNALPAVQEFIESIDTEDVTAGITAFLDVMKMLTPVITGATAAMLAYKTASAISGLIDKLIAATKGQTIAQAALNAVMNANPFVLITTLIAGLVTAFITFYTTNETFRNKVNDAWNSATTTITGAVTKIKTFFTEDIPNAVQKALDGLKSIPSQMKQVGRDLLTNLWNGIQDKVEWLKSKVRGIGESIKSIFTGGSSKTTTASGGGTGRQAVRSAPAAAMLEAGEVTAVRATRAAPAVQSAAEAQSAIAGIGDSLRSSGVLRRAQRDIDSAIAGISGYYSAAQAARSAGSNAAAQAGVTAAELAAAVRDALNGAAVTLDGRTVGRLVTIQQTNMGRAFGTA